MQSNFYCLNHQFYLFFICSLGFTSKDDNKTNSVPRDLSKFCGEGIREGKLNFTRVTENGKKLRKNWTQAYVLLNEYFLIFGKDAKTVHNLVCILWYKSEHLGGNLRRKYFALFSRKMEPMVIKCALVWKGLWLRREIKSLAKRIRTKLDRWIIQKYWFRRTSLRKLRIGQMPFVQSLRSW